MIEIGVSFIFDEEGWVIPYVTICGDLVSPVDEALKVARDDDGGLRLVGLDPVEVGEKWRDRSASS